MLFLRKSRPRFQGWKHINLYRLCYGDLTTFYTLDELQGIKALGFDSVRLCFRGDDFVTAQYAGDLMTISAMVATLVEYGNLCLQAGLLVNFDFHPSGSFGPAYILANGDPTTPYFLAYKQAVVGIGRAIGESFLPEQVMLDILNEPNPPGGAIYWSTTLQPSAFAAVRQACPHLTLGVRGEGDAMANLSNLNVSDYDWNTLYSVHNYDFVYFTYSTSTDQGAIMSYLSQVDYPPDGLSSAGAVTRATANINADTSLNAAQKASYIEMTQYNLYNYYTNLTRYGLLNNQLPVTCPPTVPRS